MMNKNGLSLASFSFPFPRPITTDLIYRLETIWAIWLVQRLRGVKLYSVENADKMLCLQHGGCDTFPGYSTVYVIKK